MPHTVEEMAHRLSIMDEKFRHQKRSIIVTVLLLGCIMVGTGSHMNRRITAEVTEITDEGGNVRAAFGIGSDGQPSLRFFRKDGSESVRLWLPSDDSSVLMLGVGSGSGQVTIRHSVKEGHTVDMSSRDGSSLALLMGGDGTSFIDAKSKLGGRINMRLDKSVAAIGLANRRDKTRAELLIEEGKAAYLQLLDEEAKPGATVLMGPSGVPGIMLEHGNRRTAITPQE